MSNYTKTTDFAAKDSLPSGNSDKIIKGAEFETEFDDIATAIATKADADGATLTGTTSFETLSDGTISVTAFVDEDDMSSNSATLLPTQQSVKAYVDSQVTAQDLDFQGDTGGALSIDLDSETLTVAGGTGIDTAGSLNTLTVNIDSTVATLTGTQTLTNKTLTSPDVNTPDIDGGTIDGTVIGGTTAAAGSFTTVSATGNITVGGTVDGRDVATDGTKLDGIAAGAEVNAVDSVNTQTGAVVLDADDISDSTTTNKFTTAADISKLAGIEAGATADQTAAEIRTLVEAATDSNVFTDADHTKLNGIEASADVTDTANVTAAGALMDSELTSEASVKALNQGVATTDSPTFAGIDVTGTVTANDLTLSDSTPLINLYDTDGVGRTAFQNAGGINYLTNYGATSGAYGVFIMQSHNHTTTKEVIRADNTNIQFKTDGILRGRFLSNGDYALYNDAGTSTDFYWDASTSRLGLGTSSPNRPLHVSGIIKSSAGIEFGSGPSYLYESATDSVALRVGSDGPYLEFIDAGSNVAEMGNASGPLALTAAGAEKIRIDSSGNVGINTQSPSTALDVAGTVTADSLTVNGEFQVVLDGGGTNPSLYKAQDSSGGVALSQRRSRGTIALPTALQDGDVVGGVNGLAHDGTSYVNTAGFRFKIDGTVSTGVIPQKMVFETSETNSLIERLVIRPNGDVSFNNSTATAPDFYWDASESRLGLGTTSPATRLHVYDSSSGQTSLSPSADDLVIESSSSTGMTILSGASSDGSILFGDLGSSLAGYITYRHSTDKMFFGTNGVATAKVAIDSAGNVGINNTNPARSLHINDTMRLEPRSSAPTSPAAGDIYFDSTLSKLRCYDGTAWNNLF